MKYYKVLKTIWNKKYVCASIGYFFVGYLWSSPWVKDGIDIVWADLFSWDSFVAFILPVFLFVLYQGSQWLLGIPAYMRIKDKMKYIKFFFYETGVISFSLSILYVAVIVAGNCFFRINTSGQMQYVFKYAVMLFFLLMVYGLAFFQCLLKQWRIQICFLVVIILPMADFVIYFYHHTLLLYMRFLFASNMLELFQSAVLGTILILLLKEILGRTIRRMEMTGSNE